MDFSVMRTYSIHHHYQNVAKCILTLSQNWWNAVTNYCILYRSTEYLLGSSERKCISTLVNPEKPKKNQTSKDYCSEIFTSQVKKHGLEYSSGITEVVFNTYKEKCLKGATRVKKEKVYCGKYDYDLLRLGKKKTELFQYLLTEKISEG